MPQFQSRIVLRRRPDRKVEVSIYSLDQRREHRFGMLVGPDQISIDREVKQVKDKLEREGHEVQVVYKVG